ncbi:hypothetical protein EV421DRAFT_1721740 [Armillaria borealis]|uniref:Uncharacterized protein n=1 Tax=Armillaria borealis TaxID=47425 RepID=A0AA39IWK2_9AGAR|nr:hypothetical protein EV421DRAFT_1721740 [Armillaria borealis]
MQLYCYKIAKSRCECVDGISAVPVDAGVGAKFAHSNTEFAVLILPHGSRSYKYDNVNIFEDYVAKNAHDWYSYFNGQQRRRISNGQLYLVTACVKCYSWANTCHLDTSVSKAASFKCVAAGIAGAEASVHWDWEADSGVYHDHKNCDATSTGIENQSAFLCGFAISVRTTVLFRSIQMACDA